MHRQLLEAACELFESGDTSAAVAMFMRAAKLGSLEAQVNLGNAYADGQGVKVNFNIARHWYKNAAKRGVPQGAFNLAIEYKSRKELRLARYWFGRALYLGHEDAKAELRSLENDSEG